MIFNLRLNTPDGTCSNYPVFTIDNFFAPITCAGIYWQMDTNFQKAQSANHNLLIKTDHLRLINPNSNGNQLQLFMVTESLCFAYRIKSTMEFVVGRNYYGSITLDGH
jgi:hypothetical protein